MDRWAVTGGDTLCSFIVDSLWIVETVSVHYVTISIFQYIEFIISNKKNDNDDNVSLEFQLFPEIYLPCVTKLLKWHMTLVGHFFVW